MSDNKTPRNAASKIIRARALKILNDTRAGMDPVFLQAMEAKFSTLLPEAMKPDPLSKPPNTKPKNTSSHDTANPESVDKDKIRKIVMDYMKNRDDKSRH